MNKFWNFTKSNDSEEIELKIDGDIKMEQDFWDMLFGVEGFTAKGFISELNQYKGKDLTVWVNSYGGDVYAASCIYTALKEHKGKVTIKIDGVAMSAASVIAMAGDEVCMSPTSIMMIHNPWGAIQGEAKDMRHYADVLDQVKESIINAYQMKTQKSRNKICDLMNEETYMSAKKALAEGFIDKILYQESDNADPGETFMFSRLAVQNSTLNSTKEFFEEYQRRVNQFQKNENLQEKEDNPVDFDLYNKIIQNIERRKKLWD